MLTRLRVNGFKNLVDVDARFGPFTCVAGPNGVGKSNLFDAILFLRELANESFVEAATRVRGGEDPTLLFAAGADEIRFTAEMLIPGQGVDEFGQQAVAASTLVEYTVSLGLRQSEDGLVSDLELRDERLDYIKKGEARTRLGFPHKKVWRDSVLRQTRSGKAFISTDKAAGKVKRHQDQPQQAGKQSRAGRALEYDLANLPRTVLSSARNAQESRTAVLVRREMQSWRLLQLEPSAMRRTDDFRAPDYIGHDGAHLPATLYRLVASSGCGGKDDDQSTQASRVLARLSNRLANLVQGVGAIRVARDDERKLFKLLLTEANRAELPAASLSDGTLRFLALALIEEDPKETGVICLEEPENGIHPSRVEAMLDLLRDIAMDPEVPSGEDNPLRQVVVNTHSPTVVELVPVDALLFAQPVARRFPRPPAAKSPPPRLPSVALRCIEGAWRSCTSSPATAVALGDVLAYLNPARRSEASQTPVPQRKRGYRRVQDYVEDRQRELDLGHFS